MSFGQDNNRSNHTFGGRTSESAHKSKMEKVGDKIKSAFGGSSGGDGSDEYSDGNHASHTSRMKDNISRSSQPHDESGVYSGRKSDMSNEYDTPRTSHGTGSRTMEETGRPNLFESSGVPLGAAGMRKESVEMGQNAGSAGNAFGMSKSEHDSALTEGDTFGSSEYGDAGAGPNYAYQKPGDEFATMGRTMGSNPPRSSGTDALDDSYDFNERSESMGADDGFEARRKKEEKEFGSTRRGFGVTGGGGDSYGSGYIE